MWRMLALFTLLYSYSYAYTPSNFTTIPDPYQGQSPPVYPSPQGKGISNPQWIEAYSLAQHLVSELTLEEKVNLTGGHEGRCVGNTASIPRIGWDPMCVSDGPSGVRDFEFASAFPAGLVLGATFDRDLMYRYGQAVGEEYRDFGLKIALGPQCGPLGRIARGGRNWEGFSNDPYLAGVGMGQVTRGMQEKGTIAVAKHWLGNEQEERRRAELGKGEAISSNTDDRTLHELYAFPVMDALREGAVAVMSSYNRLNNSYASQNSALLNGILKTELGFEGMVMSDWNSQYAGVASANAGLDLNMPDAGWWGGNLTEAVRNGSVDASRVDDMVTRQLAAFFYVKLESEKSDHATLAAPRDESPVNTKAPEHDHLIREIAAAGTVLVKNKDNFLPLKDPKFLTVYGYDAELRPNPWGNNPGIFGGGPEENFGWNTYNGTLITGGGAGSTTPAFVISPFHAITQRMATTQGTIRWNFVSDSPQPPYPDADACLVFINAYASEKFDRISLVDDFSDRLVQNLAANFTNVVVVIHNAGIRLVDPWIENPNVTAVLYAGLPGQQAGNAIVDVLWGDVNPSGRLPFTIAKKESHYGDLLNSTGSDDTFPQDNFSEGLFIDYRAFEQDGIEPRFPFGYGLSYTTFEYRFQALEQASTASRQGEWPDPKKKIVQGGHPDLWESVLRVRATVTNSGLRAGHAVPQLYVSIPNSPKWQLRGFERVGPLEPGETRNVVFELTRRDLSVWDVEAQQWRLQQDDKYSAVVADSYMDFKGGSRFSIPFHGEMNTFLGNESQRVLVKEGLAV